MQGAALNQLTCGESKCILNEIQTFKYRRLDSLCCNTDVKEPFALKMESFSKLSYVLKTMTTLFLIVGTIEVADTKTFKLGLMCPRKHLRLGWDINAAAASMAIEKAKRDNLIPGHNVTLVSNYISIKYVILLHKFSVAQLYHISVLHLVRHSYHN